MNLRFPLLLHAVLASVALQSCDGGAVSETVPVAGIELGAALGTDESAAQSAPRYSVQLSGSQVLPAVDTRHTGQAEFAVDAATGQLFGTVTTSLATDTDGDIEVHLHEGAAGEVGGIVVRLIKNVSGVGNYVFDVPANTVLTAPQLSLYNSGNLYVDIHTAQVELRGQLSELPPSVETASTLADLQIKVFTPVCSGCHTGGGESLPSIMNLSNAEASHNSLVGVFSIGEPSLLRVDAGNSADSLLIHKVEGTQRVGSRMPFRGAKLDSEIIDALVQWINTGARQ